MIRIPGWVAQSRVTTRGAWCLYLLLCLALAVGGIALGRVWTTEDAHRDANVLLERALRAHGLPSGVPRRMACGEETWQIRLVGTLPRPTAYVLKRWWWGRWVREMKSFGPLDLGLAANGSTGWDSVGGASTPLSQKQSRSVYAWWELKGALSLLLYLRGKTVSTVGQCVLPGGASATAVRFAGAAVRPVNVYFIRGTGLLAGVGYAGSCNAYKHGWLRVYAGYRSSGVESFPTKYSDYVDGSLTCQASLTARACGGVSSRVFSRPEARMLAGGSSPISVVGGRIVVPVSINGLPPARFLLSTTHHACSVYAGTTDAASIRREWIGMALCPTGWSPNAYGVASRVNVGRVCAVGVPMDIIERAADPAASNEGCIGYLGIDFLARYCVTFNYSRRTLTLGGMRSDKALGAGERVDIVHGRVWVEADVNGADVPMVLDTLNDVWLAGHYGLRDLSCVNIILKEQAATVVAQDSGCAHKQYMAGSSVQGVPLRILYRNSVERAMGMPAGILGWQYLSHFVVTIDYPHSMLYLKRVV